MTARPFNSLTDAACWFGAWLREGALPLWATAGVDSAGGGFHEAVTVEGRPFPAARRARAQARQVWVYATAAAMGFGAGWLDVAEHGYQVFIDRYRRADHLFARVADGQGMILDSTAMLYDQAFALLAMAALHAASPAQGSELHAAALREALANLRNPAGGWREAGDQPFQANAHMHLLEASLAWEDAGNAGWREVSDEIAGLALDRFIHPARGFLREFFDESWRPLDEHAGGLVEPGHQFEWAWLLDRWGRMRREPRARNAARRLYGIGLRGVDPTRCVAVASLWENLAVRDPIARLWPQTERLKAALVFDDEAEALAAAQGLARYLQAPARGAWRDKMLPDGSFVDEPAPATSFYHLLGAILPLLNRVERLERAAQR